MLRTGLKTLHLGERTTNVIIWMLFSVFFPLVIISIGALIALIVPALSYDLWAAVFHGELIAVGLGLTGEAAGDLFTSRRLIFKHPLGNRLFKGFVGFGCLINIIGAITGIIVIQFTEHYHPSDINKSNLVFFSFGTFASSLLAGALCKWKER